MTNPGDTVFSYAGGKINAIGIVASNYREQPKPYEFGKSGSTWSNIGWAVPIDWVILFYPITPKEHISSISPLLPKKHSPLQANGNGNGNQSCYLASIQDELGLLLLKFAQSNNINLLSAIEENKNEIEEVKIFEEINTANIESTEKEQLIKARKGQGKFRQNVEKLENKCRVTGISAKNLLIASHIKPWRKSSNLERLDGNNGLLLSPHIDKLFDQGWISFLANGDLIFANNEVVTILRLWGINLPINVGSFSNKQIEYLKYHNQNVYKG